MKMEEERNRLLLLAWATCFLLACLFAGCAGDVPDDVVYTDLHKTVKKGDSATLKCEFRGEPIGVYWMKEIGKDQWTDLITWVEGTMLPGSCLADDSCDMNQDYSLIINHVQIADRGRYMCRISNYLGILIHNYTDITIYAPPEEPYPIIKECTTVENQPSAQRCSIRTNNTSMDITCSASSFFPELNLFFLHGSDKVSNTVSNVSTNEDGTKNKFISIKGSRSEIPYVCVASDIPGSTDERTATVFLRAPTVSTPRAPDRFSYPSLTTMASDDRTDPTGGVKSAKIVVPIIIIALAGGTVLIVYCWLKRRMKTVPTDKGESAAHYEFITDTPADLILQEDEAVISCSIRFSPPGAKLTTPVKGTLDHHAHFTNPRQADIVLYTRSKDGKRFVRIPATTEGYPRCNVRTKDLDLYIDHFSDWWIVALYKRYFVGKRINCTPCVQPPVTKGRTHSVLLYIYDDLADVNRRAEREMEKYMELSPPKPFFVKWKSGDVVITLLECEEEHEEKIEEMRISEQEFYQVSCNPQTFWVKPSTEAEVKQRLLKFVLYQGISTPYRTLIRSILEYDETDGALLSAASSPSLPPLPTPLSPLPAQVSPLPSPMSPLPTPVSQLPSRVSPLPSPMSPLPTPVSPLPSQVSPLPSPLPTPVSSLPSQVSPLPSPMSPLPTPVSPLPSQVSPLPSPMSSLPSLVSPSPQSNLDTEYKLEKVAEHVPPEKYTTLCNRLGINYSKANRILIDSSTNHQIAVRKCLAIWMSSTGGSLDKLRDILIEVELRDLLRHL